MATHEKVTLLLGGNEETTGVNRKCWKLKTDGLMEYPQISIPEACCFLRHSICKTPFGFVLTGGEGSKICLKFVASSKNWSKMKDMLESRCAHGSVCLDGGVYVIGGTTTTNWSSSVDHLDLEDNTWQRETELPVWVKYPKVAAILGSVYVFEWGANMLLMYQKSEKTWETKSTLFGHSCIGASLTSHNDKLYLAGGDGKHKFAWYDPEQDDWTVGTPPKLFHSYGALIQFQQKLYILGGSNGRDDVFGVEEYDFATEEWKESEFVMPLSLYNHFAVEIDINE